MLLTHARRGQLSLVRRTTTPDGAGMPVSLPTEVLTLVTLNRLGVYPPDQSSATPVWALGASLVWLSKVHLAQATWLGAGGPRVAEQRSIGPLFTQSEQLTHLQVQIFSIPHQSHHWIRSMQWKSRPPEPWLSPAIRGSCLPRPREVSLRPVNLLQSPGRILS